MAVHYSHEPDGRRSVPYCGEGVTVSPDGRNPQVKVVGVGEDPVVTAPARAQVDCAACITQMDTDGIP